MKLLKLLPLLMSLLWISACSKTGNVVGSSGEIDNGMDVTDIAKDSDADVAVERDTPAVEIDTSRPEARVIINEDYKRQYQGYDLAEQDELQDPSSPLANRVIYFDYDSAVVGEQDRTVLSAHAAYLADNANVIVRLIGHTDERGSHEYNLALGERRAAAVRQLLMLQGASMQQFQVISLGEERPQADGHHEFAWQQNRRVELLYLVR